MAASKKSAKRSAGRKKKSTRKTSAKGGTRKSTAKANSSKRATAARAGMKTVRQVGEKTWKTLKNTTAQVVEGVKDTFGG